MNFARSSGRSASAAGGRAWCYAILGRRRVIGERMTRLQPIEKLTAQC